MKAYCEFLTRTKQVIRPIKGNIYHHSLKSSIGTVALYKFYIKGKTWGKYRGDHTPPSYEMEEIVVSKGRHKAFTIG